MNFKPIDSLIALVLAAASIVIFLLLSSCDTGLKVQTPITQYSGDLAVRMLACDYVVKCREGLCVAKQVCPPGFR